MDDRERKMRLWLENPPEMNFPEPLDLPGFPRQSFRSHQEMDAWKREYLKRIARQGGIRWKFS